MRKCYIIFEYFDDVKCENSIKCNDTQIKCGQKIRCSRIVRLITTDRELAIRFTRDRPELSYQEETL